jgi:hypothetical protein
MSGMRLENTYEKAPVKAKAFFWVRRQTPIRVHPEGVTLSCIR